MGSDQASYCNRLLFRDSTISTSKYKKEKGVWLEYISQKSFLISDVNIEFKAS